MKYKLCQHVVENLDVSFRLRFKLFEPFVSYALLYSLDSGTRIIGLENHLDGVQRTMLRRMAWLGG